MLRQGETIELTGTEYELLLMLAREPGRVFSRDDILNQLRGHEVDLYTRAVDIVVSRLAQEAGAAGLHQDACATPATRWRCAGRPNEAREKVGLAPRQAPHCPLHQAAHGA